jgi:ABC-type glycerol-3-phosphate transport system substrate-binding protein
MHHRHRIWVLLVITAVGLLAACDALSQTGLVNEPVAAPSPEGMVPEATATAAVPATQAPLPASVPEQLRIWLPAEIGARTPGAAETLTMQLREFNARHPELELVVEQKPFDGPGGILAYLRAGREVAPGILPDVVAVPGQMIEDPSVRELLTPLEELVAPAAFADLYPAAEDQAGHDGQLYGVPFALTGLAHLASAPSETAALTDLDWTRFISLTTNTLTLPADSRDGALFGLEFYLDSGGRISNDAGQVVLDVEPLAQALEQIRLGRPNLGQSYQLKSLDEAWQSYQAGLSTHVWTRSDFQQALLAGGALPETQVNAPVPGPGGPLTPLVSGWAWSISVDDPARQALAAELIDFLTEPDNLTRWSAESQTLPPRREVLNRLAQSQPYYAFAGRELERARAFPAAATGRLLDVLGSAVYETLTSDKPARQIAEEAVLSLQES